MLPEHDWQQHRRREILEVAFLVDLHSVGCEAEVDTRDKEYEEDAAATPLEHRE